MNPLGAKSVHRTFFGFRLAPAADGPEMHYPHPRSGRQRLKLSRVSVGGLP